MTTCTPAQRGTSSPPPRPTVAEALDVLAGLGYGQRGYARQIADYLLEHGHRGRQVGSTSCPVAQYCAATTGLRIAIDRESWAVVTLWAAPALTEGATPATVSEFIDRFDAGYYPELVVDDE